LISRDFFIVKISWAQNSRQNGIGKLENYRTWQPHLACNNVCFSNLMEAPTLVVLKHINHYNIASI
jgi:hypothetical protein